MLPILPPLAVGKHLTIVYIGIFISTAIMHNYL
jgi:hypothetical protein